MSFNLIITCEPGRENIDWVFSQINSCIGTSYVIVRIRSSLILLAVSNPYEVWYNLKKCLYNKDTPIQRVIPVDEIVDPILDRVSRKAQEYALNRIPRDATYRVTLHGRLYSIDSSGRLVKISSMDAIKAIAEGIDRKVNLKNPDWVVYIRVVPYRRWSYVAAIGVAKAIVYKNIRVGEAVEPL
ncbi:conserved hypothetical protein [Ignisphaera aggregans DSM 17230]|uniref:THUMP domain-containing protein n=1 Tax=Ignisphaera aggregans (strain DSM 17230 / JCM 13409 / AQ1.S1) TaxID=583356 RepID=E0SP81_IGNAA|nr:conserved hypothetical protein [Ignisphaera aggregans DSM 17230]